MLFSELFNIEVDGSEDWFDPILNVDIPLFIDPYLIEHSSNDLIKNSFQDFIKYFQTIFQLIIKIGKSSPKKRRIILSALSFPEVQEICIGYSKQTTKGAGTGITFAKRLHSSFTDYLALGLNADDFKHIEILGLFTEGIGSDRISDISANIIKKHLIKYTQDICNKYKIPLKKKPIRNYMFDSSTCTWIPKHIELPENPFTRKGIILVPKDILRTLPTINYNSFLDYLYNEESEVIRSLIGIKITKSINKPKLIKILNKHPEFIKEYVLDVEKTAKAEPYDLEIDEKFIYKWHQILKILGKETVPEIETVIDDNTFNDFILALCDYFKKSVEKWGLYNFFWNETTIHPERHIQKLFHVIVRAFCDAHNIVISPEQNAGRGPIDFKFSQGYSKRVYLEIKFISNTKFWDGLEKQLPMYMDVDDGTEGIFMAIAHYKEDLDKIKEIKEILNQVNQKAKINITAITIDASLDKPSASKL